MKKKIMQQKCVISNLKWVLGDLEECKQMKKKKIMLQNGR
jgi:hypothetical protein